MAVPYVEVVLSYLSFLALLVLFFELAMIVGYDIYKHGCQKTMFQSLNVIMALNIIGAAAMHVNQILHVYGDVPDTIRAFFDPFGAGLSSWAYTLFLYRRTSALFDVWYIQYVVYTVATIIAILTPVMMFSGYNKWYINDLDMYALDILYLVLLVTLLLYDLLFTYLFSKQLRAASALMKVVDEEMKYVSRLGMTIVAISFGIMISIAITASVTEIVPRAIMGALTNHLAGCLAHLVFYTKFIRPFKRSRARRINSRTRQNGSAVSQSGTGSHVATSSQARRKETSLEADRSAAV